MGATERPGRGNPFPAFVFLILLILAGAAISETSLGPVFRNIGVAEGLPDSWVEAMVQDRQGYVWAATRSGLVRHEGDEIRVVGSGPGETDPLPGRNIMALHAHSDGTVWAAVGGHGLVQIGPDLHQRRHLKLAEDGGILPHDNIWSLAEDCDGKLWMAFMQGGVARFDPDSGDLHHLDQSLDNGLHPSGFQFKLEVDSECRLWLVQSEQLGVLHPERPDRFDPVYQRDGGNLMFHVGEAHGQIFLAQGPELLSLGPVASAHASRPEVVFNAGHAITGFVGDNETERLLVTTYQGLYRFHPVSGRTEHVPAIPGLPDGLPGSSLQGIILDFEGGAWISVARFGLAYMPPGHQAFERYQMIAGRERGLQFEIINGIGHDPISSELWLGSLNRGIQLLDLETGRMEWLHERLDNEELAALSRLTAIHVAEEHAFVTGQVGVLRVDRNSGRVERLLSREQVDDGTFSFSVPGDDGELWVATLDAGLLRYDLASGEVERFQPDGTGRLKFPESLPVAIEQGPDDAWWVVGQRGVYRLDADRGFVSQAELERPPVRAATWGEDLWLATEATLEQWRWADGELRQIDRHEMAGRLPPGQVHKIFPVPGSGIWLVRSSGLARFDPETGQFRNYTRNDGLATAEFLPQAAVQLDDGRLAVGGSRGLVVVDPWQTRTLTAPPPVHINSLTAGDTRHARLPGDRGPIVLKHDDNSFFVDYIALSYVAFDQNRYRVKLEGWDEDWVEFIGQTRHHYSNLSPGRYRLRVQGATADGVWNEEGDSVDFQVMTPPWLGRWALSAYLFLAVAGAGLGWKGYSNARQRRLEMREARQKRALAEEQRAVIERLNRSLEPLDLARSIGEEMLAITGGRRAVTGYQHELLPTELVDTDDDAAPMTREEWRATMDHADGQEGCMSVTLSAGDEPIARVLIEAGPDGFAADGQHRLELLADMAGQALHNALLLERVRALAIRAEQASAAKSEFLATMSHEIRTPLHGVLGMVELLHESQTDPAQQDVLGTLRQSGLQLQRIIDDVLDISRIEAGRMSLDVHSFELVAVLEQVVDLHASNASRKGLDLRLRIASGLPLMAHGDADRISQVLGNLVNNAVKFTETGGVEVTAETGQDSRLVLGVSDSGPGIGAEDRERLFEPFTQLDASITRSHSGSGLGLAICRRLVEAMEGELELFDSGHGGSRFIVRLPVLGANADRPVPRLTRMLSGLKVAALLDAPTRRVLYRLARRWQFELVRPGQPMPENIDFLLVDGGSVEKLTSQQREDWISRAQAIGWLQSPYLRMDAAELGLPDRTQFLRWPLVESRLAGLLLDRVMGRSHSRRR